MNLLNRFRIGPKITGIVLLLLLLTALVGGCGLFYLNQMNDRLDRIVDESAEKVKEATLLSRDETGWQGLASEMAGTFSP
ncbi:MAG: MCP four helix bundle domain-containing protein [Chloroflexota bacterium]